MTEIKGIQAGYVIEWPEEDLGELETQRINRQYIETFIDDPWYLILRRANEAMTYVHGTYRITQIKEKFLGLSYYFDSNGATEIQRQILQAIRVNAAQECEYQRLSTEEESNAF